MNICFEYLYRDAGNFKNWGEVIFSNRNNHSVLELNKKISNVLIDGEFFVAELVDVKSMRFKNYIRSLDHDWHEFHSLTSTVEEPNDMRGRDIEDFLDSLKRASII